MNIEKLLEFQKADLAYKRFKEELAKDANYQKMVKSKAEFDAAREKVNASEAAAESMVAAYNAAESELTAAMDKVEQLCNEAKAENVTDEQLQAIAAKLEELAKVIADGEKKVGELKTSVENLVQEYQASQQKGKAAREAYGAAKAKYEKIEAAKADERARLKTARTQAKEPIVDDYPVYKSKAEAGLYPVVVPAMESGGKYNCAGCGMQQSDAVTAELNKSGYCTCESCHRILYKQ